ncbi:MAG: TonB-dependent receptor [Bacteroidales bacterium]|nr:TonB-dependent receptor [Bacteroidales bacterium]
MKAHCFSRTTLLLTVVLLALSSGAQTLRGRVLEVSEQGDSTAVAAAAIQWLHTATGTFTDANGQFALKRAKTDTLVVTFPTYQPDTLVVDRSQNDISVVLSHAHALAEVRIVSRDGSYISTHPILTTVISQEGLRRAACCNLAESFESTVAVDMEYTDAITGARQISMLGLAGKYSQILLENVPFIRLLSYQFGLGFMPGSWMESISVSKGVASVSNGFEAITGQVNVDYKKPETNNDRLFLNVYANSMTKTELNLTSRFKVGKQDKVNTMLMLFGGLQLLKMDMNKDGFLDAPLNQQVNVMNRWDYKVNQYWRGRALADFVWDNRVGGQTTYNPDGFTPSMTAYGVHVDNKRFDFITKNGFLLPGEHESIGTIVAYTGNWTNALFGERHYGFDQQSLYVNLMYSNKFGKRERHKLTTGTSLQYDYFDYQRVSQFGPNMPMLNRTDEWVPGIFAEYCYIIDPKLVVMVGMRLDYNMNYVDLTGLYWTPRLHVKWQATDNLSLRASAGKGYRTAHVMAENMSLLTSNREFRGMGSPESLKPEEAWNFGVSLVQNFNMPGGRSSFSLDYFYTTFINQTIIDMDQDVHYVYYYNLNGVYNGLGNRSRSHSVQAELTLRPFTRFELLLAYRYNDVRYMTHGVMREKVLMSPHKAIVNVNYSTKYDKWKFNVNLQIHGPQRLPDTYNNPVEYQRPEYSKTFCLLNAQITKKFRRWEIYAGAENILNVKQKDPIIAADDPFGQYFDATMVYAPITGIMGYLGFRFVLK